MMNTMFGGLLLQDLVALKSEGVGQFSEIDAGLLAQTPCQSKVLRVVCSSPMNSPIPHNVTLLVWVIRWLFIHFAWENLHILVGIESKYI